MISSKAKEANAERAVLKVYSATHPSAPVWLATTGWWPIFATVFDGRRFRRGDSVSDLVGDLVGDLVQRLTPLILI